MSNDLPSGHWRERNLFSNQKLGRFSWVAGILMGNYNMRVRFLLTTEDLRIILGSAE
jgi:hypothetical protein